MSGCFIAAFVFAILCNYILLSSAQWKPSCNETIKPATGSAEIHALLLHSQYINYSACQLKWEELDDKLVREKEMEAKNLEFGILNGMIIQLASKNGSRIDARVHLTYDHKMKSTFHVSGCTLEMAPNLPSDECIEENIREVFIKFEFCKDGMNIYRIIVQRNGEHLGELLNCLPYYKRARGYSPINGLLIDLDDKTTNVKKILVKCIG